MDIVHRRMIHARYTITARWITKINLSYSEGGGDAGVAGATAYWVL